LRGKKRKGGTDKKIIVKRDCNISPFSQSEHAEQMTSQRNGNIRARQKLEFQLALRASKSENLLARANFPLARVKKNRFLMLINNS